MQKPTADRKCPKENCSYTFSSAEFAQEEGLTPQHYYQSPTPTPSREYCAGSGKLALAVPEDGKEFKAGDPVLVWSTSISKRIKGKIITIGPKRAKVKVSYGNLSVAVGDLQHVEE